MSLSIVFGAGAVGTWFARLLEADGSRVVVVDHRSSAVPAAGGTCLVGDVAAPDAAVLDAVRGADRVVMAVPEAAASKGLAHIVRAAPKAAVVVETLSVKTRFAATVREAAPSGPVLGVNPLFRPGPETTAGTVLLVAHSGDDRGALDDLLHRSGCSVRRTDADGHDRLMAVFQCLTHAAVLAFGRALDTLEPDPALVRGGAPPPFSCLSALHARIATGEPHVYWEIQRENPFAAEARAALRDALVALDGAVRTDDVGAFAAVMASLQSQDERARAADARRCADIFAALASAARREQHDNQFEESASR